MTFGLRAEFGKTGRIVITEGHPVPERAGWIVTPIGGSIALCHRVSGRRAAVPFGIHTTY